jgi:hypothetical protein
VFVILVDISVDFLHPLETLIDSIYVFACLVSLKTSLTTCAIAELIACRIGVKRDNLYLEDN